jgi:superfamily II DNA/RNA helicase
MDLPRDSETYLHRVGRAGRFGKKCCAGTSGLFCHLQQLTCVSGSYGVTVNFVAQGKEVTSLNEIEANCGVTITPLPGTVHVHVH